MNRSTDTAVGMALRLIARTLSTTEGGREVLLRTLEEIRFMSFSTSFRRLARLAPMLALPFVSASCDEAGGGVCGDQLSANISVLIDASTDLSTEATSIQNSLLAACDDIITDLGGTPPSHSTGTLDDQVQASCTAAGNEITTSKSGATVVISYTAPICYVDAQAQLSCEASCDVDATCTEGSIETRCTPGQLSVECSGMCQASAYCVATVDAPVVNCNGTCDGVCMGTCSGGTNAQTGECNGTCAGSCQGNCHISGSAAIDCGADVRCQGGCTGTATAPRCESELTPPMCDVDAQCQAGCEAQGSFSATCEPAQVNVVVTGGSEAAALQATLEANLPTILAIRDGLDRIVADGQALVSAVGNVATALSGVPACAAVRAQQLTAAAQAAASAAASVSVSVSVSVDVSASASGSL